MILMKLVCKVGCGPGKKPFDFFVDLDPGADPGFIIIFCNSSARLELILELVAQCFKYLEDKFPHGSVVDSPTS